MRYTWCLLGLDSLGIYEVNKFDSEWYYDSNGRVGKNVLCNKRVNKLKVSSNLH